MKRSAMKRVPGTARNAEVGFGRKARKVERRCKECGTSFLINPSQFKYYKGAGQYCSKKCHAQHKIKLNANLPIKDRYGRTNRHADKQWQQAVREKDGCICQRCGKYDPYIHAHHVAPRSRRPDLRHEISNGKCLCASCHQWVHWNPKESTPLGLLSDASYERAKKESPPCRICGSTGRNAGFQMCIKHYKRFKKYGDPLLAGRQGHPGEPPRRVSPTE
jgi:hypothetical protein